MMQTILLYAGAVAVVVAAFLAGYVYGLIRAHRAFCKMVSTHFPIKHL